MLNEGRKGQGIAIYIHNSLNDLVHLHKISDSIQAIWLTIDGSVFGVPGRVLLSGIYINPMSNMRSQSDISELFSLAHMEVMEASSLSPYILILGDFNAHLGQTREPLTHQFRQLLEHFPHLSSPRLNQTQHSRLNTAGQCLLDLAASIPLVLTTGRGKGDVGQATFFGYSNATLPSRTEHVAMTADLYTRCHSIRTVQKVNTMDHKPLKLQFFTGDLNHIDMRLPTHMQVNDQEQKLVWKEQTAEHYVNNLVSDDLTQNQFSSAIEDRNVDMAYDTLAHLIESAATDANMISRGRPARAKLNLPMPPWFDSTCRALKAHLRRFTKLGLSTHTLKKTYHSHCRKKRRTHKKNTANKVTDLIEARDVQIFKFFRERKLNNQTPIPAHVWTDYLKQHFTQNQTSVPRDLVPRLPSSHQALSDRLRTRQITPSDIAVPPGPGGRYRQGANSNIASQQSLNPLSSYNVPSESLLSTYIEQNIARMNANSSSGFDPYPTLFIKRAETEFLDGQGKKQRANVLLPLLTDLFKLLLRDGLLPMAWKKTKITPIHKKAELTLPQNYRLIAINGCIYRLYANVVRDLLTDWALVEKQISDTQFGFCPTRNTSQPIFILRHILTVAKLNKKKLFTAFLDLTAAYDSVQREKLWAHLRNIHVPKYLLSAMMAMYEGSVYILVDGDKVSDEIMATQGLKQGCPLSPLLYSLFTNDLGKFLNATDHGAMTALQTTHVSHTEYADDIALSANTATHLQLQLDRFHTYTIAKGLTLNTQKTKVMAFFCSNPPIFQYNGTPLENVQEFKYLGTSLSHNGRMTNASNQMARNFAGAIARVWKICTELGIKHRKHAMLWVFQVFALSAGLFGCQVWATNTLSLTSSTKTKAHIHHVCFLKMLLGVKKAQTHTAFYVRQARCLFIFTGSAVLSAFGTAC